MSNSRPLGRSFWLALVLTAFCAVQSNAAEGKTGQKSAKAAPVQQMPMEPKAIELLKAAAARLGSAKSLTFKAVTTYESPSLFGPPLAYSMLSDVMMQRPDKLRVIASTNGVVSEFFYNGKTIAAFAPAENLIAVADAPPTLDAMFKQTYEQAATYFPFSEMLESDPYKAMADDLIVAFYIGQSREVGGTTTDMIAYGNKNVFIQAWIGAEDKLPRRLRAVYREDPVQLRHQIDLMDWKVDGTLTPDAFAPKDAGNAKPMPFARPDAKATVTPATRTNSSRTK